VTRRDGDMPLRTMLHDCAQARSIHFYDSIVVIERGRKTIPYTESRCDEGVSET
jgi:hypothetical protein